MHTESTTLDQLRQAFVSAGWGIAIASAEGLIQSVNPAYARMHGFTHGELIGRPVIELFPVERRAAAAEAIATAVRGGTNTFESEHLRKDGSRFPVIVNASVAQGDAGPFGVVHVLDITERKRHEERLRETSLSLDVLDRLLEACQVISPDWRYLYVNDLLVAQARRPREELLGRTMMECYPGIDATPMFALLRRAMEQRTVEHMENEFSFPDGARIVFELRFVPVPQGVCVFSLDITERRHQLSALVNDSDDAIVGRTLDGFVTSWNRGAERVFGIASAEAVGQHIDHLLPPTGTMHADGIVELIRSGKRIEHLESSRRHRDGHTIDLLATASGIRDAKGELAGISIIARDITEMKETQRALADAKEAADAANKELEAFSYSVAHDLRAPLRAIDGFSQAILEDCGPALDENGKRYLGFVRSSAQLMAQLIDDMLTLSRVTRSELVRKRIDVSAIARASAARLSAAQPNRHVTVVIGDGLVADADARLIAIVFDNLLGNAFKFSGKRDDARVEVGSRDDAGDTVFFVKDNGAGFDMAFSSKLFGVFQRLHSTAEFEGTGVGLATVQRIVSRHGGRVWAEGHVDVGAEFSFTLGASR